MTCISNTLGILLLGLLFSLPLSAKNNWQVIHEEYKGDLLIRFQVKEQSNPTLQEWITIDIVNQGSSNLPIQNVQYQLKLNAFEDESKQIAHSISSYLLAPGKLSIRESISAEGTSFLAYSSTAPLTVKGQLSLNLQIQGQEELNMEWQELTFAFNWYPPSSEEKYAALEQLNRIIHQPISSPFADQQLQALLKNPLANEMLEGTILIKAIQIRKNGNDGRLALVEYLNEHFSKEEELIQFYKGLLFKKDFQALSDLTHATNIWSDQFLEPILSWFQNGNSGAMFCIMEVMEAHQKDWINKLGISTILFDLILYRYEDIIYKPHTELSDRELMVWTSAAQLISKTGHPESKDILLPFIKCKTKTPDSDFKQEANSLDIPRPLRVADVALEGLLLLEKKDLKKVYWDAGYQPPYEYGEAEIVITNIRDQLIIFGNW